MVSQLTMCSSRKNHCCKTTQCIFHGVSPSSRGRDFCCLGDFHDVSSSLPVFLPCTFLFCLLVEAVLMTSAFAWMFAYWCIFVVSLLQHLWSSFTAEACHRNLSLKQVIRHLCCRLDVTLSMQRKAVYFFFFLWGVSCIFSVLTVAFPVMTNTSSNTQKYFSSVSSLRFG